MKIFFVWTCLAVLVAVHAGTANRRPAAPAQITSLVDKDAKRKAMEHSAFKNAGRQAGLEVWRIENFEPVLVPSKDFGKFYKGDSYIVLKTKADKRNNLSWDIHFWLGSETSQDEAGAAAILTVGLDDKFNGAAIQHREVQGHESNQFTSYFSPAIRYVDGGHASGFSHVTTNAGAEKRLFQIKGKRNVRVRQIDPLISSMNKGDCFILDVDQKIYVYVGEKAKNVEKLKAISVANQIRDQDHNGRGHVDIIDQYSSESDTEKFFNALGSGNRALVPEESAGGDDQTFEKSEEQTVSLSEISDKTGSLKITPLQKPFLQAMLKPEECYILDTVSGSIYVWVGKKSTAREKAEAMSKAEQYLKSKNYPNWVHVSKIPQGTEPAAFKQYFQTWQDRGMAHSRIVRSPSDEELYDSDDEVVSNRARIIGKTGTARGFMPDQGDGVFTMYQVNGAGLIQLPEADKANHGILVSDKAYVLDYEVGNPDGAPGHIFYLWQGKDSEVDFKVHGNLHSYMAKNFDGFNVFVHISQGEEPKHFLKIFKGQLVVTLSREVSPLLFRIHGNKAGEDIRAEQLQLSSHVLVSDDVFLLVTGDKNVLWYGQHASSDEKTEAIHILHKILGSNVDYKVVDQGQEDEEFLEALGSPSIADIGATWQSKVGKRTQSGVHLYEVEHTTSRSLKFLSLTEEPEQSDLHSDKAYILDIGDEILVWVGEDNDKLHLKLGMSFAEAYLHKTGRQMVGLPIFVFQQGQEMEYFTKYFDDWDNQFWIKNSRDSEKDRMLENNDIL